MRRAGATLQKVEEVEFPRMFVVSEERFVIAIIVSGLLTDVESLKRLAADHAAVTVNIDLKVILVACAFGFHITLANLITLVGMHLNIEQITHLEIEPFVTDTTIALVNIAGLLHPR